MMAWPPGSGIMMSRRDHPSGNCKGDSDRKEEPMAVMDYQTQDRLADYGFSIEFRSDVDWRVYIIFESFQGHDDSLESPYQSIDGDERRYVDWSPKLDNLGEAKAVEGSGRSLGAPNLVTHAQVRVRARIRGAACGQPASSSARRPRRKADQSLELPVTDGATASPTAIQRTNDRSPRHPARAARRSPGRAT
jgi:hypothetical protein